MHKLIDAVRRLEADASTKLLFYGIIAEGNTTPIVSDKLVKATGLHLRTVYKMTKQAEENGLLKVEREPRKPNVYTLLLD